MKTAYYFPTAKKVTKRLNGTQKNDYYRIKQNLERAVLVLNYCITKVL